ncbi:MarR family winged helix-turn-helix transcriptional regulator [Streptomyces phaeochromogenes]|uniref:MarR family winged helix-turn-helix transcriptional regulator n=1 Tax=Streptomyces phaeochromogenes TaxID=1923 RepID=UPI00225430EE|nr:MarR family winged helix-turn-helix transcriptional regulator [Streptomyces phaeochromogenes]MCX5602468.1 MarR family winged helix-turn-helix transcriptional regulator [Streptomyces phaeochromogenes]
MQQPLDPRDLDTGALALFVGFAATSAVQAELAANGFPDLRMSHGYVFQRLLHTEPTIGDLAEKLDMTQQGASKAVAELERLGYTERLPDPHDARIRRVTLTARGHEAVTAARHARAAQEERLRQRFGTTALDAARTLLAELLDDFGGTAAVQRREVRPPR